MVGVKMRSEVRGGNSARTRPKFKARVMASPESRTVNLAGPQISSLPPENRVMRALPE